jgi:chromosome segregation ATPase
MHEEMLDMEDQAKSFRGPRKNSKEGKAHFAKMEAHKKAMADNTARIDSLRKAITQYEKTRATKQAALAKAELAMSSDPEIYKAVTGAIDKRMEKLERTISGKEEAVAKANDAILKMAKEVKAAASDGKTSPEKLEKMRARLKVLRASQTDRNKHLKELVKEREVLKARRSNRLGITRTDVLTGESVAGGRGIVAGGTRVDSGA